MLDTRIGGVNLWAISTNVQAFRHSKAKVTAVLNIGSSITRGLGAGGDLNVGRLVIKESREEISAMVTNSDLSLLINVDFADV